MPRLRRSWTGGPAVNEGISLKLRAAALVLILDGATPGAIANRTGERRSLVSATLQALHQQGWLSVFDRQGEEPVYYWSARGGYEVLWSSLRNDSCPARYVGLGRQMAA